jgi:hypothetical protein
VPRLTFSIALLVLALSQQAHVMQDRATMTMGFDTGMFADGDSDAGASGSGSAPVRTKNVIGVSFRHVMNGLRCASRERNPVFSVHFLTES